VAPAAILQHRGLDTVSLALAELAGTGLRPLALSAGETLPLVGGLRPLARLILVAAAVLAPLAMAAKARLLAALVLPWVALGLTRLPAVGVVAEAVVGRLQVEAVML